MNDISGASAVALSSQVRAGAGEMSDELLRVVQPLELTVAEVRLFAIVDGALEAVTPGGLDLGTLSDALNDDGEMDLSFAPDATVLVRDAGAVAFLGIRYTLG